MSQKQNALDGNCHNTAEGIKSKLCMMILTAMATTLLIFDAYLNTDGTEKLS